jgi:hypothetical protein
VTRDEMEARLARMSELGLWEWRLHAFDFDRLTLIGGQDMDYAHFAEAYFTGVTYISCPTRVMHPIFRLATDHEFMRAALEAEVESHRGAHVIAIDSSTTSSPGTTSLLVARTVELKEELVRYSFPTQ